MDTNVSITAEEITSGKGEDGSVDVGAYDFESLSVSMAGEARANGDQAGGATHSCKRCNERLYEDGPGEYLSTEDNAADCSEAEEDDPGPLGYPHHWPEPIAGSFANSARIYVDEHDEVGVTISVGDPRGAFVMRVHRSEADGQLYLSVPHPSDGMPHMNLTEVRPGFYKIGD
jgi:hypothetical protein